MPGKAENYKSVKSPVVCFVEKKTDVLRCTLLHRRLDAQRRRCLTHTDASSDLSHSHVACKMDGSLFCSSSTKNQKKKTDLLFGHLLITDESSVLTITRPWPCKCLHLFNKTISYKSSLYLYILTCAVTVVVVVRVLFSMMINKKTNKKQELEMQYK